MMIRKSQGVVEVITMSEEWDYCMRKMITSEKCWIKIVDMNEMIVDMIVFGGDGTGATVRSVVTACEPIVEFCSFFDSSIKHILFR